MNSSTHDSARAIGLKFPKGNIEVFFDDGRVLLVPISWYPRLAAASKKALEHYEWIGKGIGIHWPEIDEDLSVEGFLKAQKAPKNQFKKNTLPLKKATRKPSFNKHKKKLAFE